MTDILTCPCVPGCDYDTGEDCCSDACVCGDASTPTTSMRPPSLYEAKADGIHRLLGEVQELHEALACAEEDRRAHADQVSIAVEKADAERRENTRLRAENEDLTAAAWGLVLSWMAQANRASSLAETAGAEENIRGALRREARTAGAHAADLRLVLERDDARARKALGAS